MAEYVATQRRCGGVVMLSGALPVAMLAADEHATALLWQRVLAFCRAPGGRR